MSCTEEDLEARAKKITGYGWYSKEAYMGEQYFEFKIDLSKKTQ